MASEGQTSKDPRDRRTSSTYLPKLLAVLSILLPAMVFVVAAIISYNSSLTDARAKLEAQADLAVQHARRVFAIFDLAASQTEEALLSLSDAEIMARDSELSARLDRLAGGLPEVEDIWVIDAQGRALVTSTATPAPRDIDFSKQDFFVSQRDGSGGTFVTDRLPGYYRPSQFFKLSYQRRTADDKFRGVVLLGGDPRSFESFYASMLGDAVSVMSLARSDGAVLARVPMAGPVNRMSKGSPLLREIAVSPDRGSYVDVSAVDNVERLAVYRSLAPLPVYVVAAIDMAKMRSQWLQGMMRHLYFGLPATLALFFISLAAIRQSRRQADTLEELQQEEQRRAFAEEALRQSNKMEAIGRLTGGVAHDFNNLLQVMLGRLARIHKAAEQRLPPTLRDIDAMQFAIDRAANLTHRLLAFSRQQPLRTEIVDANRLIAGMTELVRQTAGNEISVETVYASDLWPIAIDANQLENAILNLTSNARDAMRGSGRMAIRTENVVIGETHGLTHADVAPGDYVCIAVSDSGHGIAPELIEKIFEPFFTTKPVGQGTGLGLSMVYGFVRQSGGTVSLASEVGHGATVRLLLPRASGDMQAEAPVARAPGDEIAGAGIVLVVEDEVEVRRLVVDTLTDAGCTVLAATTARDGLRLLEANPGVQLLLTDVGLPEGMSGVQLADAARRLRPDLRVVMMTGYVRAAGEPGEQVDPSLPLLNKPFSRDALIARVRDGLAQHATAT